MAGANWVETVFCKRECNKFIPSAKDNGRCCCGHLWQYHRDGSPATLRNNSQELHWSPTRHTHLLPTDAYGTVEFQGGPHPAKAQYIRLAHDTPPNLILELLAREWGLGLPKLLISIQGGKTNFELQPKLKKVIRKGLLKAAKTTGAWVFTGGTNTGVTRQAGEALASETNIRDRGGRIVSIGIAPWGIVERHQDLIGHNRDVPYHPINSPKSRYAALNSHHSFFLLADNGTAGKYGQEIILRRKLENYISKQRIEARGGLATPVVCVVIEGGPQTIRQVLEYVTDSPPLPVIVCDGTGRAADILAFVHKYAVSGPTILENNRISIVSSLERVFELKTEQAEKLFVELMQCVKKKDLITVFRLKEGSELDQSILSALLYSKCLSPPEQLSLALTWNRVDIARAHVFNENVEWPRGSLEQAMMDALVNDRIEFVKLLLEQGVSMKKFLTVERLEELYNSNQGPVNTLRYIIKDIKKTVTREYRYTLIDIGLAVNKLMGGAFRSSYTRKKFRSSFAGLRPPVSVNNGNLAFTNTRVDSAKGSIFETQKEVNYPPVFEYPFSELLVWAVLTKRQQMSLLMWQHGEEAVAKALVAAKLYKALAHEGVDDDLETEVYEELKNYAKEYEVLALELLDYCYQQDEDRANQLLTYELRNWSKKTCLALAVAVNHRALLSHPCCQILLADLWLGGLRTRKNTNIKVILSLLFPPLILFLGFRSREELRSMPQTCEEHWEEGQNRLSDSEADSDSDSDAIEARNDQDPETFGEQKDFNETILELEEDLILSTKVPLFNSASSHHQQNSTPVVSAPRPSPGLEREPTVSKSSTSTLYDNCNVNYHMTTSVDATFAEPTPKELPVRTKFYEFYNAPITKFWAYSGAFVVFLCVFTYVVLVKLPKFPNWPEYYVLAYISTFLLEKVREILSSEPAKLRQKLEIWSEKLWNIFDVVFTLLFLLGFCLRMQEKEVRDAGRVIYCVDIIYWYLKVLEILSANKYLGPLVMMMGKMIKNMAYFVVLLLVVLMAFGVCRQSILFPNEEPHWRLARHIFYQPYFMLYGEVFAGDIDPPCGGPGEIECQPGRWITPTVMSMYLLVANILLINLLIAVFNNIFTSVNAISHQVWMFQRFQVVMEFEEKPVFPPPLIVFSHLHRTFKYFYYKNWKRKPFIYGHGLKRFLDGENLERVHDFEEECVDAYLTEKEQKESQSTEERVRVIFERTEALSQRVEEIHSKTVLALASVNNVDFHIKRLQEDIQEANNNYAVLHRFMVSHVGTPHRSSGSGTPTSGHGTPNKSGSQLSLQRMLEDSQRKIKKRESGGHKEEEEDNELEDNDDEDEKEEEEETIRGRHGSLIVKMNLNEKKRKSKKEREQRMSLKRKKKSLKKMRESVERSSGGGSSSKRAAAAANKKTDLSKSSTPPSCVVAFRDDVVEPPSEYDDDDDGGRRKFASRRRSSSHHPDERPPSLARYDRCSSAVAAAVSSSSSNRPLIQVIPPSTPPPIITLTAEYTSLADELETVCMARLTPPASPGLLVHQNRLRSRPRHRSDSSAPYGVYYNPLRDAEEADYHLMEGIIQRRMHRDSENLAVSLEELCSIFSEGSDEEKSDSKHGEDGRGRREAMRETACLDLPVLESIALSPEDIFHEWAETTRRRGTIPGASIYPLGSPTHNLQRREGEDLQWSLPVASLATPERVSPRSSPPMATMQMPVQPSSPLVGRILQIPLYQEQEKKKKDPSEVTETEC